MTHRELHRMASVMAAGLHGGGVRQGDRVMLVLPDGVGFVAAFLAAARVGAIAVLVNPHLTAEDHRVLVAQSQPVLVLVLVGADPGLGGTPWTSVDDLLAAGAGEPVAAPVELPDDAPLYVQFTSGTTGQPKGVVHSHGDLAGYHRCVADGVFGIGPDDVLLSVSKLYFAYGFGNALVFPICTGASAVLIEGRPAPAEVAAAVRRHRTSILFSVPTFYAGLLAGSDPADFATLRAAVTAGEALQPALEERLAGILPAPVLNQIGSTEAGHAFCANAPGRSVPGTRAGRCPSSRSGCSTRPAGRCRTASPAGCGCVDRR